MDTLLPGYASRPNPSPVKAKQAQRQNNKAASGAQRPILQERSVAALPEDTQVVSHGGSSSPGAGPGSAAAETEAEAAGLSGGGFILTDQQQQQQHGLQGFTGTGDGRLPTYNSSRQRQGRTLLQQHIMMQHDVRQQQMLAVQQQVRMQQAKQLQPQRLPESEQQDGQLAATETAAVLQDGVRPSLLPQQGQQEPAMLPGQQQQQQKEEPPPPAAAPAGIAAPAAAGKRRTSLKHQRPQHAPDQEGMGPAQEVQQRQQLQQQQQQQEAAEGVQPFELRLWQQPPALTRTEHDKLLALPLPGMLRHLLLLHCHLESCYSFLLQQHIVPRWGRLVVMMDQLFPHVSCCMT